MILLMNMLIAAMSESYASLSPYKTELTVRSMASAILTIERQVGSIFMSFATKKIMHKVDNEWGISISTSEPPSVL